MGFFYTCAEAVNLDGVCEPVVYTLTAIEKRPGRSVRNLAPRCLPKICIGPVGVVEIAA
jgi:hypothetical protein